MKSKTVTELKKITDMKNFLYMMLLFAACLPACDQEIDYPYQGDKDRVHFKHYTLGRNKERIYYDVYDETSKTLGRTYSQGFVPDAIERPVVAIPVELLGRISDAERTYRVAVIPELTTAVEGVHYEPFGATQTFAAASISDTLRIVVNKNAFSTSFENPEDLDLALRIVPSDDFDPGLAGGTTMIIRLNNYLSEPDWWSGSSGFWVGQLSYYHPLKWKILISFDAAFANYEKSPYDINTGGNYISGLREYLSRNVVVDEEKNVRLFMTYTEPYNP